MRSETCCPYDLGRVQHAHYTCALHLHIKRLHYTYALHICSALMHYTYASLHIGLCTPLEQCQFFNTYKLFCCRIIFSLRSVVLLCLRFQCVTCVRVASGYHRGCEQDGVNVWSAGHCRQQYERAC